MSGGTVRANLEASGSAIVTLVGRHFRVDGELVPYGDLTAQTGTLTGRLASGDPIDNEFYQGGYDRWGDGTSVYTGTITLEYAPEPAATLLAACALATLALLRRRAV